MHNLFTMRLSSVLALVVALCAFTSIAKEGSNGDVVADCDPESWSKFKVEFSKRYISQSEDEHRYEIFCKNLKLIQQYNKKLGRSQLQINSLADLGAQELDRMTMKKNRNQMAQILASQRGQIRQTEQEDPTDGDLIRKIRKILMKNVSDPIPDKIDWSLDPTIVGPVQDQGDCGSCWSFATLALVESNQHKRFPGRNVTLLSAQQLIDCNRSNGHCDGGWPREALRYIKKVGGVMSALDYPYISFKEASKHYKCRFDPHKVHTSTTKIGKIWYDHQFVGDEDYLQIVVALNGPVVIVIQANNPFIFAKSEIIYDEECTRNAEPDHVVLLVGYGTNDRGQDYWKVKNSWGPGWGVNGYGYMARNRDNNCGVASDPVMLVNYQ